MNVDEMIKRVRTEMFYMHDGQNVGLQIAMALEAAKLMRDSVVLGKNWADTDIYYLKMAMAAKSWDRVTGGGE